MAAARLRLLLVLVGLCAVGVVVWLEPWQGAPARRSRPSPADFESGAVELLLPRDSGGIASVEWEPDGQGLLVGARYAMRLARWDMRTGRAQVLFDVPGDGLRYLGATRVVGTGPLRLPKDVQVTQPDERFNLWNVEVGGDLLAPVGQVPGLSLHDLESWKQVRELDPAVETVFGASFSGHGTRLAAVVRGDSGRDVLVYDVESGKRLATADGEAPVLLAADGASLVCGADIADGYALTLLRMPDLEPAWRLRVPDWPRVLASSPQGVLACGLRNGQILLIDPQGRLLRTLKGHWLEVTTLAFSSDGSLLASGSGDGSARLWSVGSGREQARLMVVNGGHWVAAAPTGAMVGTPGALAEVSLKVQGEWLPLDAFEGLVQQRLPLRPGPEPEG